MAGGGKQSPRQRMIGMMYLVLTALLALQVSNSVLDKFIFIDQSLQHSVKLTMGANEKIVRGIHTTVEKNGNRARDTNILSKAELVKARTFELLEFLTTMREGIIEESGGRTEEGKLAGAKDYDKQMNYTLGPGDTKNGVAYELKKKMNAYVDFLNEQHDSLKILHLALDAKEVPEFRDDPNQQNKDFAQLNFDHTPTVACLAIMSQLRSEIAQAEAKVLEVLASEIGADQLRFDKIVAVVRPISQIVAAGTKYEAEMFIAASSSSAKPKMQANGKSLPVEEGKGKIEFVAQGGKYDAQGNSERTWKGSITIPTPFGDTTFSIEEKYVVAKPVISIQAAAVQALYLNCGNELNVQVPALGTYYDPSFQASGGQVLRGRKKGFVTIVPKRSRVSLHVFSGGNKIGTEKFRVKRVPKPDLIPVYRGKPIDLKNGVSAGGRFPRALTLAARADADFKSFLPKDARYKTTQWEITLARGKRAIRQKRVKNDRVNLNDFANEVKAGDRLVIEVKRVQRMNFKNERETVPGMNRVIFTIPIN